MTQGPDDGDDRRPNEPTFADVMNGFSLDAGRKPRRRRWGRSSATPEPPPEQPTELTGPISGSAAYGLPPTQSERQEPPPAAPAPPPPPPPQVSGAAAVRPYAWTRGPHQVRIRDGHRDARLGRAGQVVTSTACRWSTAPSRTC